MTIKEALDRQPSFEGAHIIPDKHDVVREYQKSVMHEQFQRGAQLLVEAGVPGLLEELAEVIRPSFPDVRTQDVDLRGKEADEGLDDRFQYWGDGTVSARVGWDYKEGPIEHSYETQDGNGKTITGTFMRGRKGTYLYSSVDVTVLPNREDLIIQSWGQPRSGV